MNGEHESDACFILFMIYVQNIFSQLVMHLVLLYAIHPVSCALLASVLGIFIRPHRKIANVAKRSFILFRLIAAEKRVTAIYIKWYH
jgi:hypothetical protein